MYMYICIYIYMYTHIICTDPLKGAPRVFSISFVLLLRLMFV